MSLTDHVDYKSHFLLIWRPSYIDASPFVALCWHFLHNKLPENYYDYYVYQKHLKAIYSMA